MVPTAGTNETFARGASGTHIRTNATFCDFPTRGAKEKQARRRSERTGRIEPIGGIVVLAVQVTGRSLHAQDRHMTNDFCFCLLLDPQKETAALMAERGGGAARSPPSYSTRSGMPAS